MDESLHSSINRFVFSKVPIALLIFENIEIGMDPEGTFYTGDD